MKDLRESSVELEGVIAAMDSRRTDSLATHASLLERLKDLDDQGSWQTFYTTYRKLIFSFSLRHSLTPTEAEEVVQETVITVARNLPGFQYDPRRCSFKTWLFNLTSWRIQDQLRKRHPEDIALDENGRAGCGTHDPYELPGPESGPLSALWEAEWKKDLIDRALERLKTHIDEKHFQMFDLYVRQGWPARAVARSLGASLGSVYVTKHRVSALLRNEIQRLQNQPW